MIIAMNSLCGRTGVSTVFLLLVLLLTVVFANGAETTTGNDKDIVVKVFILAGQSNMVGLASIEHLNELIKNAKVGQDECNANEFCHDLWDLETNNFTIRQNVFIKFNEIYGNLTVGNGFAGNDRFGPELGFGWVMGGGASDSPTAQPSASPSVMPSTSPSTMPSVSPSAPPSESPSRAPSTLPSSTPSESPSAGPSNAPSASPSMAPSTSPPSTTPSSSPSTPPSTTPSSSPSTAPSTDPSVSPSAAPSASPSESPSTTPSTSPSESPSTIPSTAPSTSPSSSPSTATTIARRRTTATRGGDTTGAERELLLNEPLLRWKEFGSQLSTAIITPPKEQQEIIYIIKAAWGGKSLAVEFRPPSSGQGEYEHINHVDPDMYGVYYHEMLTSINDGLDQIANVIPGYNASSSSRFEISGFVWFQGFNDAIDLDFVMEYKYNLANFLQDVRKELDAPNLPIVVGELGMHGALNKLQGSVKDRVTRMRAAQKAVTLLPEFRNSSLYVPTSPYLVWGVPIRYSGGEHYDGRADTFYHIGKAFGRAMLTLLEKTENERLTK